MKRKNENGKKGWEGSKRRKRRRESENKGNRKSMEESQGEEEEEEEGTPGKRNEDRKRKISHCIEKNDFYWDVKDT